MIGLYVHVPFCRRACPYCDFDFEVGAADVAGLLEGLDCEVASRPGVSEQPPGTVYLGGGTPSSLGGDGLRELGAWLRARFDLSQVGEFTLEVNPEDIAPPLLEAARQVGVDRISIGAQTFSPGGLVTLGRRHQANAAATLTRQVVEAGFRTTVDLIVGWPGQSTQSLTDDVDAVVSSGAQHVSVYALTIEERSAWPKLVARGQRSMPDEDAQADALRVAEATLVSRGFEHYEIASYARAGARSQHNGLYWSWADYVGLGPSAASATFDARGGVTRRTNARGFAAWREGTPPASETLTPEAAAAEGLWTGLRQLEGIDLGAFLARFPAIGRDWIHARVARQLELGNLRWSPSGQTLLVAPGRWLWHDDIARDLVGE